MTQKPFKVADALRTAAAALKGGDLEQAQALYCEVIARFPGSAKARAGLQATEKRMADRARTQTPDQMLRDGHAAEDRGDLRRAIALYEAVLARDPARLDAQNDLGMALLAVEQTDRSIEVLEDLARRAPNIAEAHINLARSYVAAERYPDAVASCQSALEIAPTHPVALCNLGSLYARLGELSRATACFETCVAHHPSHADAYTNLVHARRLHKDDPLIGKMRDALSDAGLGRGAQASLHFSLGKACDDIGETDAAFAHYTRANELATQHRGFDGTAPARALRALHDRLTRPALPALGLEEITQAPVIPIFIVGMPRSGSTLIEQVLSSHSQVSAAGEIDALPRIADQHLRPDRDTADNMGETAPYDRHILHAIRHAYLDRLAQHAQPAQHVQNAQGARYVSDKNLLNFRYLGLIAAAFPDAIILHMTRDPVAVWWSNYRQNFASPAFAFAFDLDHLGAYHAAYARIMEAWHLRLPDRILDVDYDAFTAAPEAQTRALLAQCGLDFEAGCLDFPAQRGVVTSASLFQVREQVYQGSSRAWEAYRPHLAPFITQYLPDDPAR